MKNKKLIIVVIPVIVVIGVSIFLYLSNREYKYICFNIDVHRETLIDESYLKECTTNKKIPKEVITNKEELLSDDIYKTYRQIKDIYKEGEMLYKDDFILYEYPRATETNIELLNEIEVMYLGDNPEPTRYRAYVKQNKLYAINLNTKEESIIFDIEKVSAIAVRPICCTGNGQLLILTTNGNVYLSEKDCNYSFGFDFPFKKLDVNNIKSFKLVPANDYDFTKNLYGVNDKNEDVLLQKLN